MKLDSSAWMSSELGYITVMLCLFYVLRGPTVVIVLLRYLLSLTNRLNEVNYLFGTYRTLRNYAHIYCSKAQYS